MDNKAWHLQSFIDSLVYELDKARETLAIKGINNPLTYAVKDLSMDLQLFPEFDGDSVRFQSAKPGEQGASKVSINLGSITDRQIRQSTKPPTAKDDVGLDEVEEIDEETKTSLKKIGVNSLKDLEQIESENVDLKKVQPASSNTNYNSLAEKLKRIRSGKARQQQLSIAAELRKEQKPNIDQLKFKKEGRSLIMTLLGENLAVDQDYQSRFYLNDQEAKIRNQSSEMMEVEIPSSYLKDKNECKMVLDTHAVVKFNLN